MLAVIGGGAWGTAFAARAAGHGLDVSITDRALSETSSRLAKLPHGGQVSVASFSRCLEPADVVVLALPWPATITLAQQHPAFGAGKIVIETATPQLDRTWAEATNGAVEVVRAIPYVRLVKALGHLSASDLSRNGPLLTLMACDDDEARYRVVELFSTMNIATSDMGGLVNARHIESYSWIVSNTRAGARNNFCEF